MAENRISISIEGDKRDGGHVRLNDFLRQLDSVRNALRHTTTLVTTGEREAVYYRIVDARHQSPLAVTLEAVAERSPELPAKVVEKFFRSVEEIRERGSLPRDFDYQTAEAYRQIISPQKRHVSNLTLGNTGRKVAIDSQYQQRIAKAIGPDEFAEGSIAGTLDTVKLHNVTTFEVFPVIGPKRVVCHFQPSMKEDVKQALERYVCVYGRLRYKHWDPFPHAIDAVRVDVYPDEEELPRLSEMRGAFPGLTRGVQSVEFVDRVRNETW